MPDLTISAVQVQAVRGPRPASSGPGHSQVQPIHIYPEHRQGTLAARPGPPMWTESLYLRIETDAGPHGLYGPIDREAAWSIIDVYADFLVGLDPLAGTIVWDKLHRLNRHARHGYLKIGLSAIDNALWDLRGRVYGVPVWRLLGGPARTRIPAYASTLGASLETEEAASLARRLADEGYVAQKWFLANGPGQGYNGMRSNLELVETVRNTVGPDTDLMFDVFMGWDLAYATTWAREAERLRPRWLEEPFPPSQYDAFLALHRATGVPLAAGEHLYDRTDVLPYLRDGVLSALQTDPEWCGGVTDLVRICALAEPFGVPVIPHGHGVHAALHVVASQSPATCPWVEYLLRHMPDRHHFELSPPTPMGGHFQLPSAPGFGIELDRSKIDSVTRWTPGSDGYLM